MKTTFTSIVSIIGMMNMSADRTSLACISGIYVLNFNACKCILVLFEAKIFIGSFMKQYILIHYGFDAPLSERFSGGNQAGILVDAKV